VVHGEVEWDVQLDGVALCLGTAGHRRDEERDCSNAIHGVSFSDGFDQLSIATYGESGSGFYICPID
jgi:hypothetical protein